MKPKDWECPLIYMPLVTSLFLCEGGRRLSHISTALSACIPGSCLFPNLTTLSWGRWLPEILPIRMFLTPRLREMAFSCDPTSINLSLVSMLGVLCPGLTLVYVQFPQGSGGGPAFRFCIFPFFAAPGNPRNRNPRCGSPRAYRAAPNSGNLNHHWSPHLTALRRVYYVSRPTRPHNRALRNPSVD